MCMVPHYEDDDGNNRYAVKTFILLLCLEETNINLNRGQKRPIFPKTRMKPYLTWIQVTFFVILRAPERTKEGSLSSPLRDSSGQIRSQQATTIYDLISNDRHLWHKISFKNIKMSRLLGEFILKLFFAKVWPLMPTYFCSCQHNLEGQPLKHSIEAQLSIVSVLSEVRV